MFKQKLPVFYGELVLGAEYDGIFTQEHLKLYDNGIFEYTDGWTEWNGQYEMNSDSIVLDYYFPVEKPNIYMRGDDRVCAYQVIDGKRELVHDLWIY